MSVVTNAFGITQADMIEAINLIEPAPTRLMSDKDFKQKNLTTTTIVVETRENALALVPSSDRNAPAPIKARNDESVIRSVHIPHFKMVTRISPADLQNIRSMNGQDQLLVVKEVINSELAKHRAYYDTTQEALRLGAIKGRIHDCEGKKLFDAFETFGVTENTATLNFAASGDDIPQKLEQTLRTMLHGLGGEMATGATVLCSEKFFDALTSHKATKAAFERYKDNELARMGTVSGTLFFRGLSFEIYNHRIGNELMIEDGHAHAYLNGMKRSLMHYYAPGNMIEAANKPAKPYYVSIYDLPHGQGTEIYTETNPLPMCLRPKTLMHLSMS